MWAWLTEREERHRRYQRAAAGREWSQMRKQERNDKDNDSDFNDHTSPTSSSSSSASALTEAKLQARINELQQQLEALEKAFGCPVVVLNAEYDNLRSSAEAFTAALAVAVVDVRQVTVRGVLHGYRNQPAELEPVGQCLDLIAATVKGLV